MRHKRANYRAKGFALVEVAIAITVLFVAIAGTLAFNNFASKDVYRSRVQTDATMLGTMIMEAWRGQGGTTSFNPVTDLSAALLDSEDITVGYAWLGPAIPSGFTLVYSTRPYYTINVNNITYRISLSYKIIGSKRHLNVRIAYPDSLDKTIWESSNYVGVTRSVN